MTEKWGSCIILALCLTLLNVGCRTAQPDLKPPQTAERFVDPPHEQRFDTAGYPKQAFDKDDDPARRALDIRSAGGVPSRGMQSPGMGGMGGGMRPGGGY